MATPSLSRSMGRSFRNSSPILLIPKSLSSGSSYSTSRRTSSGRYLPLSKDEFYESSSLLSEVNYTVQIPGSPEQETVMGTEGSKVDCVINSGDADIVVKGDQNVIPDTMFTGGFNSTPTRRILQKMMEGDPLHDPPKDGHVCSLEGCDGKVIHNEDGTEIFPCECKYPVCFDCYTDALKAGGFCPGCREQYKPADEASSALSVPIQPRMERGLSLVRSTRSHMLLSTKNFEFDHARWLYETKGTYGYGNALQSRGEERFDRTCELEFKERMTRPLSREIKVPAAIISPYRLIVLVRFLALIFFLAWRLNNPNRAAMWLWGMSVVCEVWFGFSWLLDQVPKLMPINRYTDLDALKERFERPSTGNPTGRSDLPGIDFFVSTADPDKEPPLVTANSILSILAVDYPVEKVACYLSDDCGALLTFEAMAEAASYARVWVPFCRKHNIEPRNPENYFNAKGDATKNKVRPDFVKDRRRVKREYDEFKVRINSLPDVIRRRSDACNAREEIKAKQAQLERGAEFFEKIEVPKATWMADGNYWPGTWINPVKEHRRGDHAGIIQVMLTPPKSDLLFGGTDDSIIDLTEADTRLPMLVYVSREKRPGYDHNKKAGAMNALVRASAIMSNAPFILNLDCDHYVYNSQAVREGMCFMLGPGGENICYVQFPQRFEGIDPNDRYANHNTVFFDVNLRALDGLQGPLYVGTGCLFRRVALYGFHPPTAQENNSQCCSSCCDGKSAMVAYEMDSEIMEVQTLIPRNFGNSNLFLASIQIAEMHGRPLLAGVPYGRPVGLLTEERKGLTTAMVAEAITAISCWYEEKTEWGLNIGWIYGSVTEDVVTGYQMHNRGWRSIYCVTKRDAFHGTAPVNLTDRLHQVLRWATGSVEIFFSRNNSLLAGPHMKFLQRIAYLNIGVYPFTSIFLLVYCFLPALSLFSNEFIVETLSGVFLVYLLLMTTTLCLLAMLEVRWSGITLEEWWRNEQFWLIGSTSAHLVAVLQGLLKIMAGIDISFTLTSKSAGDLHDIEEFSDLYVIKWTSLMIPPLTIMIVNLIAIPVATARTIYSSKPDWSKLLGGASFSMWVLLHLYPFAKGFMGRRGRTPTVIWVWAGLLAITISLLWVSNSSPNSSVSTGFQL